MPIPKGNRRHPRNRHPLPKKGPSPLVPTALIAMLLAFLGGSYWLSRSNAAPTDAQTLCRTDAPPPSVSVVLIDVTDALSDGEQAQVFSEIERLREGIPRFGRLDIYAMGRGADDLKQARISICNPGRGADTNGLYQNPQLVERRWKSGFRDRLDEALNSVVAESTGEQSLIMEAVRTVALVDFGRAELDSAEKRLFVFSDFMQHVPGRYTHYVPPLQPYTNFRQTSYSNEVQTNLSGVSLHAFYIYRPRTAKLQGRSHQQFWLEHFEASGATVEGVKRIFGD